MLFKLRAQAKNSYHILHIRSKRHCGTVSVCSQCTYVTHEGMVFPYERSVQRMLVSNDGFSSAGFKFMHTFSAFYFFSRCYNFNFLQLNE